MGNGGTGAVTLTGYVKGTGTTAMTASSTIPAADISGNISGNAANVTGTVAIANGGTGQTTKTAAFDALSPNTTLGDIAYRGATNNVSLAGNTSATKQFLIQTGNGTVSAAPVWGNIVAGDVPTLNQNTTGTAANITGVALVANGGTGLSTTTAYGVVHAGTTATGNFQNSGTPGASGTVYTSNGGTALPTWQAVSASTTFKAVTVSGTQDGVNKVFTIASSVAAGSEQIFRDGQLLTPGASNDYVISGTTVTLQAAQTAPSATRVLRAYGQY